MAARGSKTLGVERVGRRFISGREVAGIDGRSIGKRQERSYVCASRHRQCGGCGQGARRASPTDRRSTDRLDDRRWSTQGYIRLCASTRPRWTPVGAVSYQGLPVKLSRRSSRRYTLTGSGIIAKEAKSWISRQHKVGMSSFIERETSLPCAKGAFVQAKNGTGHLGLPA